MDLNSAKQIKINMPDQLPIIHITASVIYIINLHFFDKLMGLE